MRGLISALTLLVCSSSFGQLNGESMFDESFVHEIRITFEQENYWDSLEYYYADFLDNGADKKYMMASVSIDGNLLDSVGVREKGYYSNWGSEGLKEPFKIDFNEYVTGKKYDGLKKLNLQNGFEDPSLMRDALAYHFMREAGIVAPRTAYAKVYLNDVYWGLYIIVEQIDNKFIKNHFENNNGNIFKCIDNTNLDWQGTAKSAYEDEFGLRSNRELDNWGSFFDFVQKIDNEEEFDDSISTVLQVNNYTRVLAADVLMLNWDSYYDHGRNFYLYEDSTLGVYHWIPWDYNLAFSNNETDIVISYEGGGDPWGTEAKPLVVRIMDSPIYKAQYFNHLCVMVDNYFSLDALEDYIDETHALITDALAEDPNKFFSMEQFNQSITTDIEVMSDWGGIMIYKGLKPFITARQSAVSTQLDSYSHSCTALSVSEEEKEDVFVSIYPNPSTNGQFSIAASNMIESIKVYNGLAQLVFVSSGVESPNFQLDLSTERKGIFFVEIVAENTISTHKLLIE